MSSEKPREKADKIRHSVIQAYKYDWNLFKAVEKYHCIHESSDSWIFFLPAFRSELIKEVSASGQDKKGNLSGEKNYWFKKYLLLYSVYPQFWFFWRDYWFNVLLTVKPENKFSLLLTLSSPPIVEEQAFKYVDFELQLSLNSENELEFLNSEEYLLNATKQRYSENLKKELSKTIRECWNLLKNGWFQKLSSEEYISSLWTQVSEVTGKTREEFNEVKERVREIGEKYEWEAGEFN